MAFDYNFDPVLPYDGSVADSVLGIVLGVYLVLALLVLAFGILSYVLQSVGMQSIAKRRGIRHAWLAWLPLGNMWILGSIADQYQYVAKGNVRNRRKALLGLTIAILVMGTPVEVLALIAAGGAAAGDGLVTVLLLIAMMLVVCVVSLIATVFQYIASYDLFASCDPNNAVVFLIVGIFIPVTLPFFIFACRKKDLGMPPRRQRMAEPEFPRAQQDDFEY